MNDQSGPPRENCPAPPSVRCFRGTYAPNGRKPIWAMTGENTGVYFSEIVNHWYTAMMSLAQLEQTHTELSPADALAELADWPEAQRELRAMILESLPKPAHSEYDVLCGMGVVGPPMRDPTPAPLKPASGEERRPSDLEIIAGALQPNYSNDMELVDECLCKISSLQQSEADYDAILAQLKSHGLPDDAEPGEWVAGIIEDRNRWRELCKSRTAWCESLARERDDARRQLDEQIRDKHRIATEYQQVLTAAQARIAELERELDQYSEWKCAEIARAKSRDFALQAKLAGLAERIRGIEIPAAWIPGAPLAMAFKKGLTAAATLVEGQPQGERA
jgi:hypothetical protein